MKNRLLCVLVLLCTVPALSCAQHSSTDAAIDTSTTDGEDKINQSSTDDSANFDSEPKQIDSLETDTIEEDEHTTDTVDRDSSTHANDKWDTVTNMDTDMDTATMGTDNGDGSDHLSPDTVATPDTSTDSQTDTVTALDSDADTVFTDTNQTDNSCADITCNHGACENTGDRFKCTCDLGWQGDACDYPVTDCRFHVNVDADTDKADGLSWATAFATIQPAVDAAQIQMADSSSSSCEVWVSKGRYYIFDVDREDHIALAEGVHLHGGFAGNETQLSDRDIPANETIIDGRDMADSTMGVNNLVVPAGNNVISGLTFTKIFFDYRSGSAILAENIELEIKSCRFKEFNASSMLRLRNSIVRIEDSIFSDNDAYASGGAIQATDSDVTIVSCEFRNNTAFSGGGAIYATGFGVNTFTRITVKDSLFENNSSLGQGFGEGGAINLSVMSLTVENSRFVNNTANMGGAIYIDGRGTSDITNTVFSGNQVNREGAIIYIRDDHRLTLNHCSTANNNVTDYYSSVNFPAALYMLFDAEVDIRNSIFWNPSQTEITSEQAPKIEVTYSIVKNGYEGDVVIAEDPQFADDTSNELHLKVTSPAIDAGNSDGSPATDVTGAPRKDVPDVMDSGIGDIPFVDIGAYEYQPL
ncbi:MAG: hypothetical protein JXX14_20920 [Deltaproteobacteria bacterium]|nr:hypothetical protein [Deltaproteobacteria bacterium]